jgi:DNA replication and repair protein RecF
MARVSLRSLHISRLRCLSDCKLGLDSNLVVFTGPNGSGKTSVLEAVHLLATGRSFRSRTAADVIQRGAEMTRVHGEVLDAAGRCVPMGIEKRRSGSYRLRIDGEPVDRLAEAAKRLPLVLITADSQRLLTDGSDGRRRLVDWLLFHVEQRYGEIHGRFRQALRQRNEMLRNRNRSQGVAEAFDEAFIQAGQQLNALRIRYSTLIEQQLSEVLASLSRVPVEVSFLAGWPVEEDLRDLLARNWQRDQARGFTTEGPHRADLEFHVDRRPARDVLSRGESKLLTVSIQIALARLLAELHGVLPVVLVDELASELDEDNRALFLESLRELGSQTLVTTVDPALVEPARWRSSLLIRMSEGKAAPMIQ